MGATIQCPQCGNRGEATTDASGAFDVRGMFEGKAVRKCNQCGAGLMLGLFGKPKVIPAEVWGRMEEMWRQAFPGSAGTAAGESDSTCEHERELEESYVELYRATRQMSEPEAREAVRAMIEQAMADAQREGTDKWPAEMGDAMLVRVGTDEKTKALILKKRREGVTDDDFRAWWNLPDLERRLLLLSSEQVRMAMFIDGLDKGMAPEVAAARMRKYFPIFGDPDDTSHTNGDDRPLPVELKLRITAWSERMMKEDPEGYGAALEASSSYNAVVRCQLLGRR